MTGEFSPGWLTLREPADAAARAADLVDALPGPVRVVRDLGCGTGSMGRWLSPRLPAPQEWILTDRDPRLLSLAAAGMPAGVTVRTELRDITALTAGDLAGADLVTCSALLDLLTAGEVDDLVAACAGARVSALFTLSVTGRVSLDPPGEHDADFEAAFNEHQRREVDGRRLLGPDAPGHATASFTAAGARVLTRPSGWRLGPELPELTTAWRDGWLAAAHQARPDLPKEAQCGVTPRVTVGHTDLLAIFG